jgi:phage N-6-adenine-methyltransferase
MTETEGQAKITRQEAGTPRSLFAVLHAEYGFDADVCAVGHNAKLPAYLTPEDDALSLGWEGLRAWCNPPYKDIAPWLAKHAEPVFVAYLLPPRTETDWWQQYKPLAECHWFRGRVQFEPPPGLAYTSNPDGSCLLLFGEGCTPGKEVWRDARTGSRL